MKSSSSSHPSALHIQHLDRASGRAREQLIGGIVHDFGHFGNGLVVRDGDAHCSFDGMPVEAVSDAAERLRLRHFSRVLVLRGRSYIPPQSTIRLTEDG